jgi:uncharacterized membrane protein
MEWSSGLFGLMLMVLLWSGLIALAVWLVRSLFPLTQKPWDQFGLDLEAGEILERRYARGEIGPAEYDVMKETLSRLGETKNAETRRNRKR